MKTNWLQTDANGASLVLRVALGGIILPHGLQKLGSGYAPFMDYVTGAAGLNMPYALGVLTVGIETLGAVLLILGLATRLNAVLMAGLFTGMIVFVHWTDGFYMNWFGQLEKGHEGFEYHLLVLAISAALLVLGGGRWSLDPRLVRSEPARQATHHVVNEPVAV